MENVLNKKIKPNTKHITFNELMADKNKIPKNLAFPKEWKNGKVNTKRNSMLALERISNNETNKKSMLFEIHQHLFMNCAQTFFRCVFFATFLFGDFLCLTTVQQAHSVHLHVQLTNFRMYIEKCFSTNHKTHFFRIFSH